MGIPGGTLVVRALEDEGVPFTFGIPGTHNIELYDALAESETVRPVLVTDEQGASFMADAVWRASGRLGCVNIVPGAGLTHAMSGIAEAWMDTIPLLVLGCGIRTDTGHGYQLHDVDQMAMVAPVTKAQLRPETGAELYPAIREACRIAREGVPGPVYVEVPANLYIFTHEVDLDAQREAGAPRSASPSASGSASASASTTPPPPDLDRAAGILQTAKRPLLYLGLGALGAADRLVALAERLEAPVATTFQGKGVFPETHPLFLWPGFGAAAPRFARKAAADCDAVLAIGCRFGEVGTGSYGIELPGPLVHVDIDPAVLGRNFPAEVALNADARVVVRELLERLKPVPADHALRQRIADGHREVEVAWSKSRSADRVTPHTLLRAIHGRFGADTVFTTDSGNGTFLAMEILRLEGPRRFLAPVDYSCMGYSVPAAVGAKLAAPDRPVVALAGDGAFLMTGLEALTAASHAVPVAIFVLRDRELAQIAQFQETALNRKTASAVHDYDAVALARSMGVEALRLERDDQIPEALERVAEITGAASPGEASPGMSNGVAGSESAASATGGSAPAAPKAAGRPVLVDVAIDYSAKTYFTRGVVKTNLQRLPWKDRVRFVGRAVGRRFFG